ncbi:MAG: cysteine peptidase family C39 domain-containing protein [Planctomycetota bacterium]
MAGALLAVLVARVSILPFLLPALTYDHLLKMRTRIDADGVCLQGTDYTCGPAAAVTALRQLGVEAEEGRLAVLAHSSWAAGTPTECLCRAVEEACGVRCRIIHGDSPAELRGQEPLVAIIRFGVLVDHFVAVLEVQPDSVVVGDPLNGKCRLSLEEFRRKWRKTAIRFDPVARAGGEKSLRNPGES